ncbi:NAD-dependent dehydratase [Hydrogenophilus thermoluteolus]|uniref:NAD-dependent epimerase/dehydratase family protein n=1 Tax=Hydrogenophilus thermoluteolus TaxID=297 RepID=UPI0024A14E29|nr:NAD-dependent epimerase/dehydratase family protein [Hydrogenophilus thermoluteolus]GLW60341.1 NAD-dependent dehydratase [Hydrogenophilus thermoluteolus]
MTVRVLVVGGGDVALRAARALASRVQFWVVVRDPAKSAAWRALGARVIVADLDLWRSLARIGAAVDQVWVTVPPAGDGVVDPRTRHLQAVLRRRGVGRRDAHDQVPSSVCAARPRVVYLSTSGVYGNRAGAWVRESDPVAPQTARAARRVAAERLWRDWAKRGGWVVRLRVPGIYSAERLPVARLLRGDPAIHEEEDSISNHIHANDLAQILWVAGWRGKTGRAYHAADDQPLPMGAWFDAVADALGLPRPPRLPRQAVLERVGPMMASFLTESRRLRNDRLKRELRFRLRYPTVFALLAQPIWKERRESCSMASSSRCISS